MPPPPPLGGELKHVFNVRNRTRHPGGYKYTYSVGTSPGNKLKHVFNVQDTVGGYKYTYSAQTSPGNKLKHVFNGQDTVGGYKYTYGAQTSPGNKLKHAFNVRARTRHHRGLQIYLLRWNFTRKQTETRL